MIRETSTRVSAATTEWKDTLSNAALGSEQKKVHRQI